MVLKGHISLPSISFPAAAPKVLFAIHHCPILCYNAVSRTADADLRAIVML